MEDNKGKFGNAARIDPDVWCLAFMDNAFHDFMMDLERWNVNTKEGFKNLQKKAYNILRPASNYMTLEMMNEAFLKRYDIVHGTTSTGGTVENICQKMHLVGREIHFLLCAAPDDQREVARKHREDVEKFYQVTPEDVVNKGKLFPQRMGLYFTHGDVLEIFWQEKACTDSVHAAHFENGEIKILNQDAYAAFIDNYARQAADLKRESDIDLPAFDTYIEIYKSRFNSDNGLILTP